MSQLESNPFQAPIKTQADGPAPAANQAALDFIAIAKKWERYRLIYNGILILETVALSVLSSLFIGSLPLIDLAVVSVFGALAVNFFFFLGPAFDGYCQWMFSSRSNLFGLIILVLGTMFSAFLAGGTIVAMAAGEALP